MPNFNQRLDQLLRSALEHHQAGRLPQAEAVYRQILQQNPKHADALHLLGMLASQTNHQDAAVDLIRQAIALKPNYAEAFYSLGCALNSKGKFDEAISAFRQTIALKPNYAEAFYCLGSALNSRGHFDEAISACRQAIALKPTYPEAFYCLGCALNSKGQLDEAVNAYRQAIALKPNYPEAYSNLGVALNDKRQPDEALTAFRRAIFFQPNMPEAYYNLGVALQEMGQLEEAIADYRQAIVLKPNYPVAHNNLGNVLNDTGQLDEAFAAYRQAVALDPSDAKVHATLLYSLHLHPDYSARAIAEENGRWNRQHAEPLRKFIQSHGHNRDPERRLRIGYVSADFKNHASAFFLDPLLRCHNHSQVEVFCYANVERPDSITERFQSLCQGWRDSVGLSDEALAEQIRSDGIDILVDLKLHTADNRVLIFARKPAPVQVAWLGYPGSTGLTTIDYRLSDPYLDPPGVEESVYSEQTVRLPDSFWCYDPLDGREVPFNSPPALEKGWVTFGCLNKFCKVNDGTLALWAQVLTQVEGSRLLLLAPEGSARERTIDRLSREGIDAARVEFVSRLRRREYLEQYHAMDLGLDSFPYNGHTTSLDSFWMGVPVATYIGQTAVGRAGWSLLSNLGLPELAGQTPEEFVRIAVALARDLPRLRELRATLRQRMEASPLMDAPRFARNMEAAYRRMWRTWCATGG